MLKEHSSFVKQTIALVDCIIIAVAFYLSYQIVSLSKDLLPIFQYYTMFTAFIAFYLYFAWTRSLFSILQFNWLKGLYINIIMIFISAALLGAAILYMLPMQHNSRTLYLVSVGISFMLILIEKHILKLMFTSIRKNDKNTTPILVFGRGRKLAKVVQEIEMHKEWGLRIFAKIDISTPPAEFENIIKNSYIEEVIFCVSREASTTGFVLDPYLRICEELGRPARVFINLSRSTHFAKWEYHKFFDYPTMLSHTAELDPDQIIAKRVFDIAGAIIGIITLGIIYIPLSIAIKLTSKGPVFFKQVRVGKNGKRFVIYKFRSMYLDAEERKKELEDQNELSGAVFKMKNDPRITPIGKLIRKLSLDEFPQFLNVLKGEMSLVGTRPPTPEEVREYESWQYRRISIKPGITGMWQVSGRNSITNFDKIVKLDLKYIDSWTIWLDIRIILKTIFVIFGKNNAY